MYKRILALLCALLLTASALAAPAIDYTLFGEVLHINPPTEDQFFLTYEGEKYSLLDDRARFDEAFSIYGGKSRAVYEYTLPQGSFSVEDNGGRLTVGRMTIDVPTRTQLTVLQGNRRSGEYAVIDSRELTDVYVDEILLPRGENGVPVLMDRIYLYTYEIAGETRRMAATLFFDYEGFTAGYAAAIPSVAQSINGFRTNFRRVFIASALFILAVWILLLVIFLRLRKKKAAAPVPADEPTPEAEENLSAGRELLERIRTEGQLIGDAEISSRTDRILWLCAQMLDTADEQPAKAPRLRRFLNYYLPTLLKLLSGLRAMLLHGVSDADVSKMREAALHALDMVLIACQKQLDNLYRDDMLDLSADIDVLEQMLVRDGFAESGLDKVRNRLNSSDD